jgi:phosphoenolpyruvate carboxykinase (ATP)
VRPPQNERMAAHAARPGSHSDKRGAGLEAAGLTPQRPTHWNLGPPALYEHAVRRGEGILTEGGAFCAVTTPHTGRSPNDKFVVREAPSADDVSWGRVNQPLGPQHFKRLRADVVRHLDGQELFVRDLYAGADPNQRIAIRFVTPKAWHALFVYNMFLRPTASDLAGFVPSWLVLHAPELHADPAEHGTRSETFIVINFEERTILIGGTHYAGELKKAVFTILNYLLPKRGVLSMHCSANVGEAGDVALFFGLSGTGKTTLSADAERALIGDDEHGWSDSGVFNFEGGCYAKVIQLSREGEPEIYATTRMFGTVLENVVVDPETRAIDLESAEITENTRASYPIHFIPNHVPGGMAGHPSHIVFLTCDAYGVMPPIARLSPAQAMYHFLSGYTAKVAGTERGVTEPKATFSTCFGAPFLPLNANVYAALLGEKIAQQGVQCWLVNTGWTGGPWGAGHRMRLGLTRAMVRAALAGKLDRAPSAPEPVFGLEVPVHVPGVPDDVLLPRRTWSDPAAYDAQAARLAQMFRQNFEQFQGQVHAAVREAGPRA